MQVRVLAFVFSRCSLYSIVCCAKNRSRRILMYIWESVAKSRSLSHRVRGVRVCRPNELVCSLRYAFNAKHFDEFAIKLSLLFFFSFDLWRTHGFLKVNVKKLIYRDAVNWQLMIQVKFLSATWKMNAVFPKRTARMTNYTAEGKYDSFSVRWWDIWDDSVWLC